MKTLNEIADAVHANAIAKGFHPANQPISTFVANQCNNMHSEITELWDSWRAGKEFMPCDKADKMVAIGLPLLSCTEEELADIIIRALDVSRRLNIDIQQAIEAKHAYNTTRPYMHGKKN